MKINDKDAAKRASNIKILIMDVDGVMTDGRIIVDNNGIESKRFDVKDGHGIKMLIRAGIKTAIITGRKSKVVKYRAKELGIHHIHQGAKDKAKSIDILLKDANLPNDVAAYIGDDLIDIPAMKKVGLTFAVSDSVKEVLNQAHIITKNRGGRGAVREVCEYILKNQGLWDEAIKRYFQ